ncbi:MAG: hypothetical protein GW808_10325 [Sphingomonadales bacterium]|nr:hypothetical protein [Sphingomonadales bacterium]NCP00745.1 hypothetical protein [Sphingomonadales bacterium]NCQ09576.1 hypothetical protein [Sphingomonadales bacterium]NCQ47334.1 hypothetical protein [Sphingomonadales bacterium]
MRYKLQYIRRFWRFLMKYIFLALASTLVFVAPVQAQDQGTKEATETTKKSGKPKKITDRRHPDYVRCRSEPVIGSLTKKRRLCMTNAAWVEYIRKGSRDSQEFVDGLQSGSNQSN